MKTVELTEREAEVMRLALVFLINNPAASADSRTQATSLWRRLAALMIIDSRWDTQHREANYRARCKLCKWQGPWRWQEDKAKKDVTEHWCKWEASNA